MSKHRIYSGLVTSGLVAAENGVAKIASMTWKDHLSMLLHIAAEIEHSLMVQYLYAAYSLGGEQVPRERREMVRCWQEDILAVAREEMGHLLTVQNILMLIGAPINLDRQDLPWDVPYHPGMFRLEQLTLDSVAFYVFAEMPSDDELDALIRETDPCDELLERYKRFREIDREQIKIMVRKRDPTPHRVGVLYSHLAKLVEKPPPHTRLGIPGMDLDPSSLGRRLGPRLSTRSTAGHGRRKLRSTNPANPWAPGAQPIFSSIRLRPAPRSGRHWRN